MNWVFKSVTVIALLAFLSPGLMAISNSLGKSSDASRCQLNCPMTEMNNDPAHHVSATPVKGSCCKVPRRSPVSSQAAITPQTWVTGAAEPAVSAPYGGLPPDRLIRLQGTAPPLSTCSYQALLCTFLV